MLAHKSFARNPAQLTGRRFIPPSIPRASDPKPSLRAAAAAKTMRCL